MHNLLKLIDFNKQVSLKNSEYRSQNSEWLKPTSSETILNPCLAKVKRKFNDLSVILSFLMIIDDLAFTNWESGSAGPLNYVEYPELHRVQG